MRHPACGPHDADASQIRLLGVSARMHKLSFHSVWVDFGHLLLHCPRSWRRLGVACGDDMTRRPALRIAFPVPQACQPASCAYTSYEDDPDLKHRCQVFGGLPRQVKPRRR